MIPDTEMQIDSKDLKEKEKAERKNSLEEGDVKDPKAKIGQKPNA